MVCFFLKKTLVSPTAMRRLTVVEVRARPVRPARGRRDRRGRPGRNHRVRQAGCTDFEDSLRGRHRCFCSARYVTVNSAGNSLPSTGSAANGRVCRTATSARSTRRQRRVDYGWDRRDHPDRCQGRQRHRARYRRVDSATGFEMSHSPRVFRLRPVKGRDGFDLADFYQNERAKAYEGVSTSAVAEHVHDLRTVRVER